MTAPSQNTPGEGDGNDPEKGSIAELGRLWRFVAPYKLAVSGAVVALVVAAVTVLFVGFGVRLLIDQGFSEQDSGLLDRALIVLLAVVVLLALATYSRYSLVSWLGERVVADLRKQVFGHVLSLDSAFFETTRVGEVMSHITTDTTLLQVVIGSSASVAMRNFLLLFGGLVMLVVTSPKLALMVVVFVPVVVAPIILIGRRVRRLSR
jgi:ATP-binding cassette subfamily B protein